MQALGSSAAPGAAVIEIAGILGDSQLNDQLLPLFAEHGMGLIWMLTDHGTEYCGKPETHVYLPEWIYGREIHLPELI